MAKRHVATWRPSTLHDETASATIMQPVSIPRNAQTKRKPSKEQIHFIHQLQTLMLDPVLEDRSVAGPPYEIKHSYIHKEKYQILVLGMAGVGKSSLVERFANDTFEPDRKPSKNHEEVYGVIDFPVVTDFWHPETVYVDLEIFVLSPSHPDYTKVRAEYIKRVHGVILVLDANNKDSVNVCETDMNAIAQLRTPGNIGVSLVGTRGDIEEDDLQVPIGLGTVWARNWGSQWGLEYSQVSCLSGQGVKQPFVDVVSAVRRKQYMKDMKESIAKVPVAPNAHQYTKKSLAALAGGEGRCKRCCNKICCCCRKKK